MTAWIDGHPDLSDTLLLIAAILFVLGAGLAWSSRALWPVVCALGLAAVAVGLLVV